VAAIGGTWLRGSSNNSALVFVHGLFSNTADAWRSPGAYWPDIVRNEPALDEHGIYLFGYDTGAAPGNYSIGDATNALHEYLKLDGLLDLRQIVFVAHSMGGIIARKLAVSRQQVFTQRQTSLGFFLVASPSLGSNYANLFGALIRLNNLQIDQLRFSQANTWLNDLDTEFTNLKERPPFPIFGRELIEADPVRLPRAWLPARQIVVPISAARYFGEPLKIPTSNHLTIAKPESAEALQHRILVDFVCKNALGAPDPAPEPAPPTPAPPVAAPAIAAPAIVTAADPLKIDPVTAAAIGADAFAVTHLPAPDATATQYFATARLFAGGTLLQRRFASLLAKRSGKPEAIFREAIAAAPALPFNEGLSLVQNAVPFLRFWPDRRWKPGQPDLVAEAAQALALEDPDLMRLRLRILGTLGEEARFPRIDWNSEWERGKYSLTAFDAAIQSASLSDSPNEIASLVTRAVTIAKTCEEQKDPLSLFTYLAAFQALRSPHLSIALNALILQQAPTEMFAALLTRFTQAPNADARANLEILLAPGSGCDKDAAIAIAFLPNTSAATARAKRMLAAPLRLKTGISEEQLRTLLQIGAPPSRALATAAGMEGWTDAMTGLSKSLAGQGFIHDRFAAAWAIGRLAEKSTEACGVLEHAVRETDDPIIRAMLLAGLARFDAKAAAPMIEAQLDTALGDARFVLLVANSYVTDARGMFAHLIETSESELYVPFLVPWLQRLFWQAASHAAQSAPLLKELLAIPDAA
jgi:hypothetical protein